MQTEQALVLVVDDLFSQLKKENIIYAEIRFAPLQHLERGLAAERVVEIILESINENARRTNIKAGVILCTLRHYPEQLSMRTVQLAQSFKNDHISVGFDLAADEAGFPIDNHKKAFVFAVQKDIPCTAHAGEAKGAESVWETIRHLQPRRIGHGVRSIEDKNLLAFLANNQIHLEVCPTSNIQTDVFAQYSDHPIDLLYRSGVSVGINTDARALTNVSLTDEYLKLHNTFGWGIDHFYHCNTSALTSAFISVSVKDQLRQSMRSAYAAFHGID